MLPTKYELLEARITHELLEAVVKQAMYSSKSCIQASHVFKQVMFF